MSSIDKLRAINQKQKLNKPTVVKEDVEQIEAFYGINERNIETVLSEKTEPDAVPVPENVITIDKPAPVVKKGPGRPKTRQVGEVYNQVHINLPESLKQMVQKATVCHRTNMSSYVISLIEKDIKENGSDYEALYSSLAKYS